MAWPQVINLTTQNIGYSTSGIVTILAWGTQGIWNNVIVRNIRSTPMINEIQIEQGGGLTSLDVIINDGDSIEIDVIDDRNLTWPISGGTVTLINPQPNGATAITQLFQVINNNYNVAAKAPGERTFIVKKYSIITPVQM
jgi:hypothetical protein